MPADTPGRRSGRRPAPPASPSPPAVACPRQRPRRRRRRSETPDEPVALGVADDRMPDVAGCRAALIGSRHFALHSPASTPKCRAFRDVSRLIDEEGRDVTDHSDDDLDLDSDRLAGGMRRLRHLRPSRGRRDHGARPACPAAPWPGGRRHRHLRRQALPFGAPPRPRRRHLLEARRDRAPARQRRHRPCPLFHDRRDDPAQCPAAVRRTRGRRLRRRP